MSTAAERAKAKIQAIRERDLAAPVADDPQVVEQEEHDDVRQTVDLKWARHQGLAHWRHEAAIQLGRVRLTNQAALEGLVGLLLTDENTSRRLIERLRSGDQ